MSIIHNEQVNIYIYTSKWNSTDVLFNKQRNYTNVYYEYMVYES